MPDAGCRLIADSFNRRFAGSKQMTVGKSFVAEIVRKYQYEIQVLRKKIKHAKPKAVPRNWVWGMDLTGKTDAQGRDAVYAAGDCRAWQPGGLVFTSLAEQVELDIARVFVSGDQEIWQTEVSAHGQ